MVTESKVQCQRIRQTCSMPVKQNEGSCSWRGIVSVPLSLLHKGWHSSYLSLLILWCCMIGFINSKQNEFGTFFSLSTFWWNNSCNFCFNKGVFGLLCCYQHDILQQLFEVAQAKKNMIQPLMCIIVGLSSDI